jgi:hypothetical protein
MPAQDLAAWAARLAPGVRSPAVLRCKSRRSRQRRRRLDGGAFILARHKGVSRAGGRRSPLVCDTAASEHEPRRSDARVPAPMGN